MNHNVLHIDHRTCMHCTAGLLRYYKEAENGNDIYSCYLCFGLMEWDGEELKPIKGEAYPLRNK